MKNRVKNSLRISLALLFVAVGLVSAPAGAVPILLSTLIANQGSITQGDKLFEEFTFSRNASGPTVLPIDASGINVEGVTIAGNYGLRFSGAMFVGSGEFIDFLIGYKATVTDPNWMISDVHLGFNGAITGTGHTEVTETVRDTLGNIVGQAHVINAPPVLSQNINLSSLQSSVYVLKDVLLVGGANGTASISFIDQALSQTRVVPEPTTLVLLGLGLLAFGASRRGGRA